MHIQTERKDDYLYLKNRLIKLGYTIKSVTVDGKKGLYNVFKDYPVQMCLFHQKRITQRYLTLKPRLQAGKDLKIVTSKLTKTNQINFTKKLDEWYEKYNDFIQEKTFNPNSGKYFYTHQKVRAAYRSLRANLPYLFTHKNYKNLELPNTTNTLEGGTFSPMKILIKIHRGLSKGLKLKIVDYYLVNHKIK